MILIVEDNKDVNAVLSEMLQANGYKTESVFTGTDAIKAVTMAGLELVLLDLMLPYKSGDQVLKEIREFSDVPVIVISAKDMVSTKVDLLKIGADDYITKPFDLDEVLARVEAALRRRRKDKEVEEKYSYKNLKLDAIGKQVEINNIPVLLTAKEYTLLELMVKHKNKVYTKANIYETIWDQEYFGDDNTIKTHISNLRAKLKQADDKEEYIETVRGLGYRLAK